MKQIFSLIFALGILCPGGVVFGMDSSPAGSSYLQKARSAMSQSTSASHSSPLTNSSLLGGSPSLAATVARNMSLPVVSTATPAPLGNLSIASTLKRQFDSIVNEALTIKNKTPLYNVARHITRQNEQGSGGHIQKAGMTPIYCNGNNKIQGQIVEGNFKSTLPHSLFGRGSQTKTKTAEALVNAALTEDGIFAVNKEGFCIKTISTIVHSNTTEYQLCSIIDTQWQHTCIKTTYPLIYFFDLVGQKSSQFKIAIQKQDKIIEKSIDRSTLITCAQQVSKSEKFLYKNGNDYKEVVVIDIANTRYAKTNLTCCSTSEIGGDLLKGILVAISEEELATPVQHTQTPFATNETTIANDQDFPTLS